MRRFLSRVDDPNPGVRLSVVQALTPRRTSASSWNKDGSLRWSRKSFRPPFTEREMGILNQLLADTNDSVRNEAFDLLPKLRGRYLRGQDGDTTQPLMHLLEREVLLLLARKGSPKQKEMLAELAKDMTPEQQLALLGALIGETEEDVVRAVGRSLERLPWQTHYEILLPLVEQRSSVSTPVLEHNRLRAIFSRIKSSEEGREHLIRWALKRRDDRALFEQVLWSNESGLGVLLRSLPADLLVELVPIAFEIDRPTALFMTDDVPSASKSKLLELARDESLPAGLRFALYSGAANQGAVVEGVVASLSDEWWHTELENVDANWWSRTIDYRIGDLPGELLNQILASIVPNMAIPDAVAGRGCPPLLARPRGQRPDRQRHLFALARRRATQARRHRAPSRRAVDSDVGVLSASQHCGHLAPCRDPGSLSRQSPRCDRRPARRIPTSTSSNRSCARRVTSTRSNSPSWPCPCSTATTPP